MTLNRYLSLPVAILAGTVLFASPAAAQDKDKSKAKTKILLVGTDPDHRHGEHEYIQGLKVVQSCLEHVPDVETVVINGWPTDAQFENAAAMVLFCAWGGDFVLGEPERKAKFLAMIKQGMGYGSIHFACDIRPKLEFKGLGQVYMEALGAFYDTGYSRNPHNTAELRPANLEHPTNRGLKNYTIHDELYFRLRFMPETEPVMVARIKDADGDIDRRIAWSYQRPDGGRSYGFTGAHFHKLFEHPQFRRLIVNGILWIAKIEIPPNGAAVDCDKRLFVAPPRKKKK